MSVRQSASADEHLLNVMLLTARLELRLAHLKEIVMYRAPTPGGNGFAVSRDLNPKLTDVSSLKPLGRETRKHSSAQLRKLQSSIEQFGIVLPVVVDAERRVVAGWGLVLAARKMGLLQVPAVTIDDLDEAKLRLLRLALNRLGEDSSWDLDALGCVDSWDSLLGANQNSRLLLGGGLGCDGSVGFERRGVGADGCADHWST